MKLIRIKQQNNPVVCVLHDDKWYSTAQFSCLQTHLAEMQKDTALLYLLQHPQLQQAVLHELQTNNGVEVQFEWDDILLPFTPLSIRDFMLFEKHVVDATRGFVRRFMPRKYRMVKLIETITRRPPKAFFPKSLWYKQPIFYMGNHLNVVGNYAAITFPPYSSALDYELELAAVLVHPIKNATEHEAHAAIGGFMIFNDFSARDVQAAEMQSGFGPTKAKNFINALSPVVVTADEILPYINQLNGEVSINNVVVSRCSSANMRYSIGQAIAHASQGEQLHCGEIFATGTFPGGSGIETNNWLKPGDRLELRIDRMGSLVSFIE